MKLYVLCLSVLLFFVVSCATEKHLGPPELTVAENTPGKNDCADIFPKGRWQFVHSIDFTMADGTGTTVVGVITLDGKNIECALVTVEGLTLFEAVFHHDQSFEVGRAVPPFDTPVFAKGLIRDIRAIFQLPPGSTVKNGKLTGGTAVCRYTAPDGSVVDILPEVDDCWQIKSYTRELAMDRLIVGRSCRKKGSSLIPDYLLLQSPGQNGYTLKMKLIRADKLE